MLKGVTDLTTPGVVKGLNTQYNLLAVQKDQSPNMMNVKVNFDGSTEKRLGSNTQNAVVLAESALAAFTNTAFNALTNGLISWWNLNEMGGTRKDAYGSNDLTDGGNTDSNSGKFEQAAEFFAGSGNYLYKQSALTLKITSNDVAMSAWFYLYNTGNSAFIYKTDWDPEYGVIGIDTNCILMAHMDSTSFSDSSLNEFDDPGKQGNPQCSTTSGNYIFGAGAFYSAGDGNKLQYEESPLYNFGTGDWTVEFWVNRGAGVQRFPVSLPSRFLMSFNDNDGQWQGTLYNNSVQYETVVFSPNLSGGWKHVAFVKSGTTLTYYQNGTSYTKVAVASTINNVGSAGGVVVGGVDTSTATYNDFIGYIDELRVSNIARYTTDFTVQSKPFALMGTSLEYILGIDTTNQVYFGISANGSTLTETVYAESFGAVGTGSWYHAYAYLDTANSLMYCAVNGTMSCGSAALGVYNGQGTFTLGASPDGESAQLDGRLDEVSFWQAPSAPLLMASKLYNSGTGVSFTAAFEAYPWACFDFGASPLRWLTCAAGTGVYASSDLGVHWVNIATDRSATYQYMDRSKNVLVMTSENYDIPLYWAGSPGTYAAVLNHSGPNCKYNINFSGYLILLNSEERKRSFNYIDENLQLTGSGWLNFDMPSSDDDEITAVFILRRYLYVCTRYKIYRVSYVGGNPDWQYVEVKSWGYVPRTVKKIVLASNKGNEGVASYSIGEVVVGLSYDRKLKIFDGSGDQIISDNIEFDNGECPFALNKLSYFGSGPLVSFAEIDQNENVYKLCVAIGQDSTQTTHMINYDGRSQSLYPYDNMQFNCMTMAESANRKILLAFDRSGYCHMMDSGNLDGNTTPINEYFESPLMFEKTPAQSNKAHQISLFFSNTTAGRMYYEQRVDFSDTYKLHRVFNLHGSDHKIINHEVIDTPQGFNAYQFRLSSSSGTNDPWILQRYDFFTQGLGVGRNY
jgi:hypothetical protein